LDFGKNVSKEFTASARTDSSHLWPVDADATFLLNINTYPPNYRASHPQRL